jgi:hypothetical protein
VHIEADVMAETVNVILAQRFAVQVFAVRVSGSGRPAHAYRIHN